jgi:hypothetical protein
MVKTLTLQISDSYFDKIISFLEMLPKKAVKIVQSDKEKQLKDIEKELLASIDDIKQGRTKKVRTIA